MTMKMTSSLPRLQLMLIVLELIHFESISGGKYDVNVEVFKADNGVSAFGQVTYGFSQFNYRFSSYKIII